MSRMTILFFSLLAVASIVLASCSEPKNQPRTVEGSGITFADDAHAWKLTTDAERPDLERSADGGRSWTTVPFHAEYRNLVRAQFAESQNGWITEVTPDRTVVIHRITRDGTVVEKVKPFKLGKGETVGQIEFVNSKQGWMSIAGKPKNNGTYSLSLHRTSDGGQTWSAAGNLDSLNGTTKIRFDTPDKGWYLTGDPTGDQGFKLYLTLNGGGKWNEVPFPQIGGEPVTGVSGFPYINGMFAKVGYLGIQTTRPIPGFAPYLVTGNGGVSWTPFPDGQNGDPVAFRYIFLQDDVMYKYCTRHADGTSHFILSKSLDAGRNWVDVTQADRGLFLAKDNEDKQQAEFEVKFFTLKEGVLRIRQGLQERLLFTRDAGFSWKPLTAPSSGTQAGDTEFFASGRGFYYAAFRMYEGGLSAADALRSGKYDEYKRDFDKQVKSYFQMSPDGGETWKTVWTLPGQPQIRFLNQRTNPSWE